MRTEKFKGVLLLTLIIASSIALAITFVSQVSAEPDPDEIIRGDTNTYNDSIGLPPWKTYAAGDQPPIMAAERIGSGAVVAAGLARMCNGGVTYDAQRWTNGEWDNMLDYMFKWMVPGATSVLWYGEYLPAIVGTYEYAYNDAAACSWLLDNLEAKGYAVDNTIDGSFTQITSTLLSEYDILVLPQIQPGLGVEGGDPTLLPDADVQTIKSFVEGGKGLLIMDACDIPDQYNFYRVHNKILEALGFGLLFQHDSVLDPDEPPYYNLYDAEVADVFFGENYRNEVGTTIKVYKPCSLAPPPEDYAVYVDIPRPKYREGLAGGTLEYKIVVNNVGKTKDNFLLENSDTAGWDLEILPEKLELENMFAEENSSRIATLRVTIPPGTAIGTVDDVTVTATSEDNASVSFSAVCVAICENVVRPSAADAQVVEGYPDDPYGTRNFMYVGSSATARYLNELMFVKFRLEALGTEPVENVRLYLWGFALDGAPDQTMRLHRVDYDWLEDNIRWSNQPTIGAVLPDSEIMVDTDRWYSWDVTSYVQAQRENENLANFAISYVTSHENYPENFSYGFTTKEQDDNSQHPYLAIGRSVRTVVTPGYKEGLRSGTLKYTVIVQNTGALWDNYKLTVGDNMGWGPKFLATGDNTTSLTLDPGKLGNATVTVTIPPGATIGENIDNLLVIATSDSDPTISDNYWFIANVSEKNTRPPKDDSTVREPDPVGNWARGTSSTIWVGHYMEGPERGFLKFDLKTIPSMNIARATLWLNCYRVDEGGAVVRVHSADDTWIERGAGRLMWTNQPPIGDVLDNRAVVEEERWYSWDVTSYVNNQRAVDNVVSFALIDLGENIVPDHAAYFTSREGPRENHPYLEIENVAPTYGVRAYVSPIFQGGKFGTTLTYTVTVKNTGTNADTYSLNASDTKGWTPSVLPTTLPLGAGASGTATLSVTVPSVAVCTLDRITVTATGNGVSDNAICFAHRSKASLGLENLYKISIDFNLRLRDDADNLVAKFYSWGNDNQGENVVWENMPWHLTDNIEVPHPQGKAVENVRLVLVDETGAEIATIETFTVRRSNLMGRLADIDMEWPYASLQLRSVLMAEIAGIDMQWPYASY